MLKLMVFVFNSDSTLFTSFIMDHDDVMQRKRLGMGCRNAFEHGQRVVTVPEGHESFEKMRDQFTDRQWKNFYTKDSFPKQERHFKPKPKQGPKGKASTSGGGSIRH